MVGGEKQSVTVSKGGKKKKKRKAGREGGQLKGKGTEGGVVF